MLPSRRLTGCHGLRPLPLRRAHGLRNRREAVPLQEMREFAFHPGTRPGPYTVSIFRTLALMSGHFSRRAVRRSYSACRFIHNSAVVPK